MKLYFFQKRKREKKEEAFQRKLREKSGNHELLMNLLRKNIHDEYNTEKRRHTMFKHKYYIYLDAAEQRRIQKSLGSAMNDIVAGVSGRKHPEIQPHHEGFVLVLGNRTLSAVEAGLVNVMSRETVLRQYILHLRYHPGCGYDPAGLGYCPGWPASVAYAPSQRSNGFLTLAGGASSPSPRKF